MYDGDDCDDDSPDSMPDDNGDNRWTMQIPLLVDSMDQCLKTMMMMMVLLLMLTPKWSIVVEPRMTGPIVGRLTIISYY